MSYTADVSNALKAPWEIPTFTFSSSGAPEGGGPAPTEAVRHPPRPAAVPQLPQPGPVPLAHLETDETAHAGTAAPPAGHVFNLLLSSREVIIGSIKPVSLLASVLSSHSFSYSAERASLGDNNTDPPL